MIDCEYGVSLSDRLGQGVVIIIRGVVDSELFSAQGLYLVNIYVVVMPYVKLSACPVDVVFLLHCEVILGRYIL